MPRIQTLGENAAQTPGTMRFVRMETPRAVLVSQVDIRRTEWEDSNVREEIWRPICGTVVADWLGDADPSEWYDGNIYRISPQYIISIRINISRANAHLSPGEY